MHLRKNFPIPMLLLIEFWNKRANVEAVINFCQTRLGLKLTETDISSLSASKGNGPQASPLIIKFATRFVRDLIFLSRRLLRHPWQTLGPNQLFINEHLTKGNSEISAQTRRMIRESHFCHVDRWWICICQANSKHVRQAKANSQPEGVGSNKRVLD